MGINKLIKEISQIEAMVSGWKTSPMNTIEREIVLEKLRSIYEEVIFMDLETISTVQESQDQDTSSPAYSLEDDNSEQISYEFDENQSPNDQNETAQDINSEQESQQDEEIVYIDDEDSQIEVEDVEDLATLSPNAAPCQESEDEPQAEPEDNLNEELKDMLYRSKLNDAAINSLYGENSRPTDDQDDQLEPQTQETQELENVQEAQPQPKEPKPTKSIRESIGMNDKYLMTRNMFDSDSRLFEQTINELDQMTDFNDALLYINDNFSWNPDDNSVKLLISILEEKLLS